MVKKLKTVLARAKKSIEQGKYSIANEAFIEAFSQQAPSAVSVKSYTRIDARDLPRDERGVFVFQWFRDGIGFGELTLTTCNGRLVADTETMSPEFVLEVIKQALEEGARP